MTTSLAQIAPLPPAVRRAAERLASLPTEDADRLLSAIDQHLARSCTSTGDGDDRAAELAVQLREVLAQVEPGHAEQHKALARAAARYLADPLGCTDDDAGAWFVNPDRAALDAVLDWLRAGAAA